MWSLYSLQVGGVWVLWSAKFLHFIISGFKKKSAFVHVWCTILLFIFIFAMILCSEIWTVLHINWGLLYVDFTILAVLQGELEKQQAELNRVMLHTEGTLQNSSLSKSLVLFTERSCGLKKINSSPMVSSFSDHLAAESNLGFGTAETAQGQQSSTWQEHYR